MTISDSRVDELAQVAAQLAARVRDEEPNVIAHWLERVAPSAEDQRALVFILAAAIPIDTPFAHLTAWVRTAAVERDEVIKQRRAVLLGEHVEPIGAAA